MNKIKCVVPISGGKDSQLCLKLALLTFQPCEILGLFCDTHFEHPTTYKHVENMAAMYGVHIESISGGTVEEKVIKYGRFPGGGARFCTDELKIIPSKKFYKQLAEKQGGFEVWVGVRSDESPEREKRYRGKLNSDFLAPHEFMPNKYPKYLEKLGVVFRVPIIEWSRGEVFEALGGEENPLYAQGFDRVGCQPCLASGDKNKEKAFAHDAFGASQKVIVLRLSKEINRSIWTSKGGKERNAGDSAGCALCNL